MKKHQPLSMDVLISWTDAEEYLFSLKARPIVRSAIPPLRPVADLRIIIIQVVFQDAFASL